MYSGALIRARIQENGFSVLTRSRKATPKAQWSVQTVSGTVTARCLWHACKAFLIGLLLITIGASMATVGFVIVAACVMTFEARDSAAKIVPARFRCKLPVSTASASNGRTASGLNEGTSSATLDADRSGGGGGEGVGGNDLPPTDFFAAAAAASSKQQHDNQISNSLCYVHRHSPSCGGSSAPLLRDSRHALTNAFLHFSKIVQGNIDSGKYSVGGGGQQHNAAAALLKRCPSDPVLMTEFHACCQAKVIQQHCIPHCYILGQQQHPYYHPHDHPGVEPTTKRLLRVNQLLITRQAISVDNPRELSSYHSNYSHFACNMEDAAQRGGGGGGGAGDDVESELDAGMGAIGLHSADSEASMTMDLHLPDCSVTLTVKDESKRGGGKQPQQSPSAAETSDAKAAAAAAAAKPKTPTAAQIGRRETAKRRPLLRQSQVEHPDSDSETNDASESRPGQSVS